MKDKIKQLLGLNLPNNVVASAVGVSDSYISQLLSEDAFAQEVQELRLVNLSEHATRDKKWDGLEDGLLEKLQDLVESPLTFTKPMEILRALQVVNGAKRRAAPAEMGAGQGTGHVVPLILPIILAPRLSLNPQGQVIEVEGRTIATMPASAVNKQLTEARRDKHLVNERLVAEDSERAATRIESLRRLTTLGVQPLHELV